MGSIGPDWTAVEMQEPSHEFESSLENKRGDFRNQANRIITKPGNKTKLKPCSKAKIDELFVTWLSFDKTRDLISSLIENARCGRPLMPLLSPTKQKNQGGHYKVLGSPPLSPSKAGVASPRGPRQDGSQERTPLKTKRSSLSEIPRFYFPNGKPISQEVQTETRQKLGALLEQVLELPSFFSLPLFNKLAKGGGEDPKAVTEDAFFAFWDERLAKCDHKGRAFEILCDEATTSGSTGEGSCEDRALRSGHGCPGWMKAVTKRGLHDLVECVVKTHPGLDFLVQTKEFQDRYLETCVYRILYTVNLADNGRITLKEFRKSILLETLLDLEAEPDINLVRPFFSYEHFYVIYCKFWELDRDHDFLVSKEDLLGYGSHALTCRIVDRIFAEAARKFTCDVPGNMSYEDFVWFILSEEDKTTETAINYWFRCLDLHGNGVLVSHELEHFYQEQSHRIECLNQDPVQFEDILTQLTDMVHPEMAGVFALKDMKQNPRQASNLFNVLFNLKTFFSFEMKDPQREQRSEGLSDWDRFARDEYARLSLEEEMAEEANGNIECFIDETEHLLEAMET